MRRDRLLPLAATLLFALLLVAAGWQWRAGPPLATDLLALLPATADDALLQQAEQRMRAPLDRELLLLVGHPERERAIALARRLGAHWQTNGSFAEVQWRLADADLDQLRSQLRPLRLSLLTASDKEQLIEAPAAFMAQRAAELFDTFGNALFAPAEDWLGLGGRAQRALSLGGSLQPDSGSGVLLTEAEGVTWALLRARIATEGAFDLRTPAALADDVAAARAAIERDGGQLLAAGGALFAAAGQAQATRESSWIGGGSLVGIVALLLFAYRRARVLVSLLPVVAALVAGCTACVWLFGQINTLTLVLGVSLIGIAADFPQHYLSKSWSKDGWRGWASVRQTLPGLSLSLGTNLIGYLALALTPFPALTQVAVFSATGLLAAYICAVALLPACLGNLQLRPPSAPLRLAERLLAVRARLVARYGNRALLGLLLLFCASGLWQLESQNDVRQWLGSDPALARQAATIATLTGQQPTSQFFLVRGSDESELLARQAAVARQLDAEVAAGRLHGYRALSQLVGTNAELTALRRALRELPSHWRPLQQAGVPEPLLRAELDALLDQPRPPVAATLTLPLAEPWRDLWLSAAPDGSVAGLISLQGRPNHAAMEAIAAAVPTVRFVDRLAELDDLFAQTQWVAAALKLAACGAIFLLLRLAFGSRGAVRVVAMPLLAAAAAAAALGWLGQPLTLFSLFGLLLITALGVDYAILMRESIGGMAVSLVGALLAAATSWLSFGLLMLSATPVIANFGLAVTLGLLFSCLLAPWAARPLADAAASLLDDHHARVSPTPGR